MRTFGIYLGCGDDRFNSYLHNNKNTQDVAYKLLNWAEDKYDDDADMWQKIIETLKALEMNRTIRDLGLRERLAAAEEHKTYIWFNCQIF